ncbi:MAG: methyltransferase domain-containing protein [Pseudomonadota bacterium]|nr:methyltransferase domain-containing protein [Pseudomonadota bacterium]
MVDLACGSGILGLLALKAGAARVYCIDEGAILDVARESFRRNGLEDRVSLVRGRAQQVNLPERADVAVCDNVGWFGFDYGIIELLRDARARLLKPQARVVPRALEIYVVPVESPLCMGPRIAWPAMPVEFEWLRDRWTNAKHPVELQPGQMLATAANVGRIDLTRDSPELFTWSARFQIERAGVLHGLAGWFGCELGADARMTNSPTAPERINRPQVFLPIDEPVAVAAGEAVEVTVMARPEEGLIAWQVSIAASGRRFDQSTFHGTALSASHLARTSAARVPTISPSARARGIVWGYCDGQRTLREIEESVLRDFPALLPCEREIRRFVADVLAQDAP